MNKSRQTISTFSLSSEIGSPPRSPTYRLRVIKASFFPKRLRLLTAWTTDSQQYNRPSNPGILSSAAMALVTASVLPPTGSPWEIFEQIKSPKQKAKIEILIVLVKTSPTEKVSAEFTSAQGNEDRLFHPHGIGPLGRLVTTRRVAPPPHQTTTANYSSPPPPCSPHAPPLRASAESSRVTQTSPAR